ncbi:hypothetical protein IPA_02225 [Ignicoccus pacificus DSM 13166]|uniref:Radical SAM core domain-containing protein n=1 Tax=Ignicoccus pacificus DSM 13166 TaxID=940294 RepID=A0A977KAN0_9CREN|nr:hypothetical protein IPA_02225 [Ignicoccus pacificus DSM 13166]
MEIWEFVIKPSIYISSLCYSILRIEPWDTCSYSCLYCYARWYRGPHGFPKPKPWIPKLFERIVREIKVYPKPFFRLATLSEPFQRPWRGLFEIFETAERYEVPLVVNTKSDVRWNDLFNWLLRLADKRLLLVQVTVGFLESSSLLEPRTPSPWRRLELIERLREHGVPVVARVQPLIPGLEEEQVRVAREALERGALGIITESLRESEEGINIIYKVLGVKRSGKWEPYDIKGRLIHPSLRWRLERHFAFKSLARSYGKEHADCKDVCEFRGELKDCCLTHLAFESTKRPTLRDLLALGRERACEKYLCGDRLRELGKLARPFRMHEKLLLRAFEKRKELCPLAYAESSVRGLND